MKYSVNITIQNFIERLVEVLKYENTYGELNGKKLDVPFLVSVLWQDLMDNYECYDEFCSDLRDCDDYDIVIGDDNYSICKVNVFLYNDTENDNWKCVEESDFRYEITFSYDERNWGYCEWRTDDKDYREDERGCGRGCDWDAPNVYIYKRELINDASWQGDQHDYWDFEDKFYLDNKKANEKRMKEERACKIRNLKETIENAQKELKKLENL